MEQPGMVAANFGLIFSLHVLSIFVHISGSFRPITLIWASLERSIPPVEVEHRWCQFFAKARHGRLRPAWESMGQLLYIAKRVKRNIGTLYLNFVIILRWMVPVFRFFEYVNFERTEQKINSTSQQNLCMTRLQNLFSSKNDNYFVTNCCHSNDTWWLFRPTFELGTLISWKLTWWPPIFFTLVSCHLKMKLHDHLKKFLWSGFSINLKNGS